VVLAIYLTRRTDFLIKSLNEETKRLLEKEDTRAKQLIDEGNKRLETILKDMHQSTQESEKRWAERDKSWQEFFERMDCRSEQIDKTTKEILGKILEKVSG